ncbi:uncharacterized protein EI90DRAFT_2285968 [Cantharellus anzutake]|uniref:uncharacterized protein n=1 Tax=Cantharellus anzutake TaxID=1750568 RepID=UPI001908D95B|nr:uncharacterized protein EI90DRAFT_2285968 [Cantharellus anzutake]KAF8339799.1 hypothetical protein EI90DRAFT_2285968 [Cantharellus anzutake]
MQSSDPCDSLDTIERTTVVVGSIPVLLHDTLHVSDIEVRGLVLFSTRKEADCEPETIPNDVIVKLSWEGPSLPTSDSLYRRAEQHGVRGVARLYYSTLGRLSEGPRTKLNLKSGIHYWDRELRVQILGPSCVPLYRVFRDQDFETASDVKMFKSNSLSLSVRASEVYGRA